MRILVFLEPVTVGAGAYNHWIELSKKLESRGHVVHISSLRDSDRQDKSSLKINPRQLYKFSQKLRSLVREMQPDLIVTTISQSDIAYWLFRRFLGMTSLKWVVVALGVPYPVEGLKVSKAKRLIWKKLWIASANAADSVGAIGSRLANRLEGEGLKSLPTTLKPIIDFSNIEVRSKHSDGKSIYFVGRLSEEKNPEFFCRLHDVIPGFDFNVAGDGPDAADLKLRYPNINFLGKLPPGGFWLQVDKVFLTSKTEGIPLTLLEASMRKTPFLASAAGSIVDLIHPENREFLLLEGKEMHDLDAWSSRFQMLERANAWPELVQKQLEYVSSKFNPEILADEFIYFLGGQESD
jgi:glycosyltransferase involved in cell wall biosynthesis